jgi:8-oxo-dGTP pyrophosphatase MutT (NUDIX family)
MDREFSAGGVVYKRSKVKGEGLKVFWLVTKSTPSKKYPKSVWRLPKGWIDDKENGKSPGPIATGVKRASESELQKAALREVEEEAGISAKIVKKIGTESYFRTEGVKKTMKFVTFYLMKWQSDLPEGPGFETEEVEWLKFNQARKKLSYTVEKEAIDKARFIFNN